MTPSLTHVVCVVATLQDIEECLADLRPLPPRPPSPSALQADFGDSHVNGSNRADGVMLALASALRRKSIEEAPQTIAPVQGPPASIAVDIEGVRLCREGKVSIVQLLKEGGDTIWLLDVTTLGNIAFEHEDGEGRSIKKILESADIVKLFYDVRNDADALYNLFDIDMRNVLDLQMLELARRKSHKKPAKLLESLARSIETYVRPPLRWKETKEEGIKLFSPGQGGTYAVFEERPLDPRILEYCAQDVSLLHQLEVALWGSFGRYGKGWDSRIQAATETRLKDAKKPEMVKLKSRGLSPAI